MIKILTVGGYDEKEEGWQLIKEFAGHFGKEVVGQGHVLLVGCRNDFDRDIAKGAYDQAGANIDERLTCYVPKGVKPTFDFGKQRKSQLENWDPAYGIDIVPELIDEADVVVFVGGYKGVNQAAIWSDLARKPMLPIGAFGGAAEKLYHRELVSVEPKYAGRLSRQQFQDLIAVVVDKDGSLKLAERVVSMAEHVLVSKVVAVMMSYTLDDVPRKNLENSYRVACEKFDYELEQVTELTAEEGIVREIHDKIRQSAFVLADFTDLKPNVFYEFGFAQGLGKRRIVTAKKNTELPFDVKDVPTLFWEDDWADLQSRLIAKIEPIAKIHGRVRTSSNDRP